MVKAITIVDYLILAQIVFGILFYRFSEWHFKILVVYFAGIIFFCYWLIRIIFNPRFSYKPKQNIKI